MIQLVSKPKRAYRKNQLISIRNVAICKEYLSLTEGGTSRSAASEILSRKYFLCPRRIYQIAISKNFIDST